MIFLDFNIEKSITTTNAELGDTIAFYDSAIAWVGIIVTVLIAGNFIGSFIMIKWVSRKEAEKTANKKAEEIIEKATKTAMTIADEARINAEKIANETIEKSEQITRKIVEKAILENKAYIEEKAKEFISEAQENNKKWVNDFINKTQTNTDKLMQLKVAELNKEIFTTKAELTWNAAIEAQQKKSFKSALVLWTLYVKYLGIAQAEPVHITMGIANVDDIIELIKNTGTIKISERTYKKCIENLSYISVFGDYKDALADTFIRLDEIKEKK